MPSLEGVTPLAFGDLYRSPGTENRFRPLQNPLQGSQQRPLQEFPKREKTVTRVSRKNTGVYAKMKQMSTESAGTGGGEWSGFYSNISELNCTKSLRDLGIFCAEHPTLTLIVLVIVWLVSMGVVIWASRRPQKTVHGQVVTGAALWPRNPHQKGKCPAGSEPYETHTDPPSGRYDGSIKVVGLVRGVKPRTDGTDQTTDNGIDYSTSELNKGDDSVRVIRTV